MLLLQVLATDAGEYKCSLPTVSGTQTDFTNLIVYGECLIEILSFSQLTHKCSCFLAYWLGSNFLMCSQQTDL